jgi:hypothetical protein
MRPLALTYAERRPLEERRGGYDEAREVWVVRDNEEGEAPLVRMSDVVLEETVTKQQIDPSDRPRSRRGMVNSAEGFSSAQAGPVVYADTKTSVSADVDDWPPRPRRAVLPRRIPEQTLTFVDAEGTDESRPSRAKR